jgi:hypothetical protein
MLWPTIISCKFEPGTFRQAACQTDVDLFIVYAVHTLSVWRIVCCWCSLVWRLVIINDGNKPLYRHDLDCWHADLSVLIIALEEAGECGFVSFATEVYFYIFISLN